MQTQFNVLIDAGVAKQARIDAVTNDKNLGAWTEAVLRKFLERPEKHRARLFNRMQVPRRKTGRKIKP